MNLDNIRKSFPHIEQGKIYLNHASIGPVSSPVFERIKFFAEERSKGLINNYELFIKYSKSAKAKLASILNCSSDEIAWVDNVSNGLNILAQGIDWKTCDRIILFDKEFPSNIYPFLNLQKRGVIIDFIHPIDGVIRTEDIEKKITSKTKLLSISFVQFLTGFRADLNEIGELCKKNNIIFCVDAIQGAGVFEIDVEKSGVDFLVGGTQKWFMSLEGLSYVYCSKNLLEKIHQHFVGWTSVEGAWNLTKYDLKLKKTSERFQNGTINSIGVAAFDKSLDLFIEAGIKNISKRVIENTTLILDELNTIGLKPLLKSTSENYLSGIVTFKSQNSEFIFNELEKRNIFISLREGMLRISPHFYNTANEIKQLFFEIKKLIS